MKLNYGRWWLLIFLLLTMVSVSSVASAMTKGIYITQFTLEDTDYLTYLIKRSKAVGIDTFIVDFNRPSKKAQNNTTLLKSNNITYVARIVVFPYGGTPEQITSEDYWAKRYELIEGAISYGAQQIQLDYIRYNTAQPSSSKNAEDILKIITWYKKRLAQQSIPLQIDVFGISSFGESKRIGQNIKLFSQAVDVICPMVYPSHYEPFRVHAVTPYETVLVSLNAIKRQFENKPLPFKLIPYIELSNYRYPLSKQKKYDYIRAQLNAVQKAEADGWYAWSPSNKYDNLFHVLELMQASNAKETKGKPVVG